MARIVKFHAAKSVTTRTVNACTNQFYGEKCDKGINGLYPLCKSIPTAIQHLPKGIAFINAL